MHLPNWEVQSDDSQAHPPTSPQPLNNSSLSLQEQAASRGESNTKKTTPPRRPEPPRVSPNNAAQSGRPQPRQEAPHPPQAPPPEAVALMNMQEELQRTGTGSVTFQEPLESE